jgi:large subunit ribosomal protein L35
MPKVKSHSSSKKRFKKTSNGKIKRAKAFRRHHAWAKNSKRVRDLRGGAYVHSAHLKNITQLIPY